MRSKSFPVVLALLLFGIAFVNYLAGVNYWYWTMRWFDMPMHFVGGVWVAGAVLWFQFFRKEGVPPSVAKLFLWAIVGVFVVGLGWEVYEGVVAFLTKGHLNAWADTASDLVFDVLGATVVALWASLRRT